MADEVRKAVETLTSRWSRELKEAAMDAAGRLEYGLGTGASLDSAIAFAFQPLSLSGAQRDRLLDVLVRGAARGAGIPDSVYVRADKAIAVKSKVMSLPWAADNMPLSDRLHGADEIVKDGIRTTVKASMVKGTSWRKLAQDLFDGYGHGETLTPAALSKYMGEVQAIARATLAGLPVEKRQYDRIIAKARGQLRKMSGDGAPNQALKASYLQLLKGAESGSEKALTNAINVAMQEKARYYAERIARTETARAWGDGFWADVLQDPDVVAVRWVKSSRHPVFDICDFNATADLYGLGPGIFPKTRAAPFPAHPHCMCSLEPIYKGEIPEEDLIKPMFSLARGDDWLRKAGRFRRQQLLGVAGNEAWEKGEIGWKKLMRNFQGHAAPLARFLPSELTPAKVEKKTPEKTPTKSNPRRGLRDRIRAEARRLRGTPYDEQKYKDLRSLGLEADRYLNDRFTERAEKDGLIEGQKKIAEKEKRIQDLRARIARTKGVRGAPAKRAAAIKEIVTLRSYIRDAKKELVLLKEEVLLKTLGEFVDVKGDVPHQPWDRGGSKDIIDPETGLFTWGVTKQPFPRSWLKASAERGPIRAVVTGRGYYCDYTKTVSAASAKTMSHEFAHRMEYTKPELMAAEHAFYVERTGTEKAVSLKTLTSIGYAADEVARPDRFLDPYVGKEYFPGPKASREILSMGVEGLFHDDYGVGIGGVDADYRRFILGVLLGVE